MSILKSSAVVSAWTMASRVLGFVRDIVIASKLGVSAASDAFFIATLLPNVFRRLFAEGGFNVAFVPIFTRTNTGKGQKEAEDFASAAFTWLLIALLVINIVAQIFMGQILQVFFSIADNPEKFDLAMLYGRITFPYLFLITLTSLMGGICNSFGRFAAFAFMPILLNVGYLACIFILPKYGITPGMATSIGMPVGGVMQLAFMTWALWKTGFKLNLKWPPKHANLNELLLRLGPAALTVGILQISLIIDNAFAGKIQNYIVDPNTLLIPLADKSVSYLNYANKFYQFPLALIGIAMATVLLPHFSRALEKKDFKSAKDSFAQAFSAGNALGLAAMVGLFLVAEKLLITFFGHGKFTLADAHMAGMAMMAYCLGLPGYITAKIAASAFYANKDTKTPVKIAVVALISNVLANLILMQYFGHVGIAAGTAVSGWVNGMLLFFFLKKQGFIEISLKELMWPYLKGWMLAILILVLVILYGNYVTFAESFFLQAAWLVGALSVGFLTFVIGAHLSGLFDFKHALKKLRS